MLPKRILTTDSPTWTKGNEPLLRASSTGRLSEGRNWESPGQGYPWGVSNRWLSGSVTRSNPTAPCSRALLTLVARREWVVFHPIEPRGESFSRFMFHHHTIFPPHRYPCNRQNKFRCGDSIPCKNQGRLHQGVGSPIERV